MIEPRREPSLWLFAVACALTVALLHVALVASLIHVFNQFTWTSRDIVWMAPVAYLALFFLAALPAHSDPNELTNLAKSAARRAILQRQRQAVDSVIRSHETWK